ncbi:TetR/AcrR family transcriptional regulator [Nocardia sp. NPDC003482]|uniref:TetR/AcrR family transcriptional regulator n=1 Tax=Nocardia sp. NPDC004068 TaxID=3364303 RepID=UPI003688C019
MSVRTDETAGRLPRGRHRLSRAEVESSQHRRLCGAALDVVGEFGYAATTVGDIVARARVARRTFYAMFAGKDECFAAAYDFGVERALDRVTAAIGRWHDSDFGVRVRISFETYLDVLAAAPAVTRALYVEALVAGGPLVEHRARVHRLFADYLTEVAGAAVRHGELAALPDPRMVDMLLGGIDDRIRACLNHEGAQALPSLAPLFTDAALRLCDATVRGRDGLL